MSGSARRRSRGPNQAETPPDSSFTIHQQSHILSKPTILTVITVTLVIAGVFLTWFQWNSNRTARPFSVSSNTEASSGGDSYVLHPEDHTNREATTLRYQWRITRGQRRPDGVLKEVYLINDAFPGPTVEARSGDRLVVEVENGLHNEGVSLHWHGLSLRGSNDMDGAVGITQNSIQPAPLSPTTSGSKKPNTAHFGITLTNKFKGAMGCSEVLLYMNLKKSRL